MANRPLTDKDRVRLNESLRELEALKEQIQIARTAGIQGADKLEERCTYCSDNIKKIKSAYFPNKP